MSNYSTPKVTIDLEEYNELKKLKTESVFKNTIFRRELGHPNSLMYDLLVDEAGENQLFVGKILFNDHKILADFLNSWSLKFVKK